MWRIYFSSETANIYSQKSLSIHTRLMCVSKDKPFSYYFSFFKIFSCFFFLIIITGQWHHHFLLSIKVKWCHYNPMLSKIHCVPKCLSTPSPFITISVILMYLFYCCFCTLSIANCWLLAWMNMTGTNLFVVLAVVLTSALKLFLQVHETFLGASSTWFGAVCPAGPRLHPATYR